MKTLILISTLLIGSLNLFSQTNFDRGFNQGYKKGYCLNEGITCLAPLPPLSPLPQIGESMNSYQDGYNRGFEMGLSSKSESTSSERQRYKTSSAEPIDYIQRTDLSNLIALAKVLKEAKNKSIALLDNGDYQASINIAEAALKVNPRDAEFMMICASGYLELENYQKGVSYLKQVVRYTKDKETIKNSNDIIQEIASGEYQKQREMEKSPTATEANNSSNVNHSTASTDELQKALSSNDYKKALQISNEIVSIQNSWVSYAQRGSIQFLLSNYSESVVDYTKAIALNVNARLYFERASAKEKLEDYYGALSDYDKLIEVVKSSDNIDMATVYNNKAYNLVNLKRISEALPIVNKALQLNPKKWYIWDTRGEIHYKLGYYKNCIEDMTKAIEINSDGNSYYYRGLSKIKMGDKVNGCQDLSKSGELGYSKAYDEIKLSCK